MRGLWRRGGSQHDSLTPMLFVGRFAGLVWSDLSCDCSCVLGEMATPAATGGGGRRTVNMLEAKTHLSRLVEAIETGAATEVVIARNGRPVARLTALQWGARPRRLGSPAESSRFRTRSMPPIR
nr:type II toxin-antitoxin system Phd/YefM family antitoxin [Cyanobium sp. A1C-AMD]